MRDILHLLGLLNLPPVNWEVRKKLRKWPRRRGQKKYCRATDRFWLMPSQTTVVTSEKPTPSCTFDSTPLLNNQQAVGPVAHIICKTHAGLPCFCTENPSPLHEVNQHLTTSLNQLRALVHIANRKTNNHITLNGIMI